MPAFRKVLSYCLFWEAVVNELGVSGQTSKRELWVPVSECPESEALGETRLKVNYQF